MQYPAEALLLSLIPAVGWGVMFFFVAKATRQMEVFQAQFLFQLAGIPMLLLLLPFVPPIEPTFNIFLLIALGMLEAFVLSLYFYALKIGELAVIGPIYQANIAITVSLAVIFLHDKIYSLKIVGILAVLAGIVLVGIHMETLKKGTMSLYKGVAPALLATFGTGFYLFLVGISSRMNGWYYTSLGIRIVIALTILGTFIVMRKKLATVFVNVPWKYVVGAALCDVIAFSAFNFALTRYEVSYVTVIGAATPAVTTLLAVTVLKEKLKVYQVIGLGLVILGIVGLNIG